MKSFAVFALAVLVAPAVLAQHRTFAVNPDASEIKMTLKTTHEVVNGTFHIQSGSIEFERSNPKMSGSVAVLAGSGKTGNNSRDKKMNKDILKVDQYTTVSFAPETYTGTIAPSGDSTVQVSGVFTLLGNPHDLTIPIQIMDRRQRQERNSSCPTFSGVSRTRASCSGKLRMTLRLILISLAGSLTNGPSLRTPWNLRRSITYAPRSWGTSSRTQALKEKRR